VRQTLLDAVLQAAKKLVPGEGPSPQRLKPHSKQCGYRSAEALRHPKSRLLKLRRPKSRSTSSFSAGCLATLVTIGLLSALIGCYSGGNPARIGSNAPDFTVQDSDHKVTLSQFRGQVVVLNFWGTFCPPCIEETPSLVQMQKRLKDKGVVVLAISIDNDDAAYHKFLKDYKINLVTVRDGAQKTSSLYGTFGWPETYVIDRNGMIRRKFIGAVDWSSPEITDYLSKL
jgi:cytochrome c biogenesis protein CcmG/thiol:disulfide interchange protein DsbE